MTARTADKDAWGDIEGNLNRVKSELASLAFLVKGLQSESGGDSFYGLGLILEEHWKILDHTQERILELLR